MASRAAVVAPLSLLHDIAQFAWSAAKRHAGDSRAECPSLLLGPFHSCPVNSRIAKELPDSGLHPIFPLRSFPYGMGSSVWAWPQNGARRMGRRGRCDESF